MPAETRSSRFTCEGTRPSISRTRCPTSGMLSVMSLSTSALDRRSEKEAAVPIPSSCSESENEADGAVKTLVSCIPEKVT